MKRTHHRWAACSNQRRGCCKQLFSHSTPPFVQKWTNEDDFANVVMHMVAGKDFVGNIKVVIEENSYPTPACLAILKITCEMVILLMQHHDYLKEFKEKQIIDAMSEAAETMAGLESCMLFSGVKHDCYGVAVEPLYSVLVEKAQKLCQ